MEGPGTKKGKLIRWILYEFDLTKPERNKMRKFLSGQDYNDLQAFVSKKIQANLEGMTLADLLKHETTSVCVKKDPGKFGG
jgi:hypothetical protein